MAIPAAVMVPAISTLLGGILQNRANKGMAREQMAFQERMSSSSYQRAVDDMKMAGINPMLAYMQGGASSPGGASVSQENILGAATSSAQHGRRLSYEVDELRARTQAAREAGAASAADARLRDAQIIDMGLDPAAVAGAANRPLLLKPEFWTPGLRQRMQEMESKQQQMLLQSYELAGARSMGELAATKWGGFLSKARFVRESLLGGSPFFVGPRIGGSPSTTINRTYNPTTKVVVPPGRR